MPLPKGIFYFNRRRDYREVFGSEAGQRVLQDLLRFGHRGRQLAVPGDPYSTYFNDGMRRVTLRITGILRMTDEEIHKLLADERENNDVSED